MLPRPLTQLVLPVVLVVLRPPLHPWSRVEQWLESSTVPLPAPLPARRQLFALRLQLVAPLLVHVAVPEWVTCRVRLVPRPLHRPVWLTVLPVRLLKGRPSRVSVPPKVDRASPDVLLERAPSSLLAVLVVPFVLRWPFVQRRPTFPAAQ